MKRLLTSGALFLCSLLTFAQFSGSGSGTENDPYLILNPIQLNQLRNFLNQSGVYFKLMADIDLTEFIEDESPTQGWQPVGNSSAAFKGVVDGNGKTISGLWINRTNTDNVGLFGYIDGATIKNLNLIVTKIEGNNNVGSISGYSQNVTFSDCSVSGTIQGVSSVGGYIGYSNNFLSLTSCLAVVKVTGTGENVGGFFGKMDVGGNLSVSNCTLNDGYITGTNHVGGFCGAVVGSGYNENSISSTNIHADIIGNDHVGGICGYSENYRHTISLNSCGYIGNLTGNHYIGGLVGYAKNTGGYDKVDDYIQKSFAISMITATGDYVGGLVGYDEGNYYRSYNGSTHSYSYLYNYTNISNCYFSGFISGRNVVGGLIGYKKWGYVSNSYAIGRIAGQIKVGGLVGSLDSETTLKTSAAINTRVTATGGEVGRIVGTNNGTLGTMGTSDENKSYNRTIVINQGVAQEITDDSNNGTGVSATTLKLKATYVAMGWDFNNTWEIQETECYPYMKTQTAPPVITSQLVSGATTISGKCVDGGTVTLEVDGDIQQMVSNGNTFSFAVSPLQAGHEVRLSAKAEGKEQSYYTTEVVSYLGRGTEADPYQVYTAADLTGVYRKGYFKLMNDIDLTDYIDQFSPTEGWESIGRDGSEAIHFDGDGHKITGLWCNSTRENTGLFSCFANGTIKNLTVEVANDKQVKGGNNTGILIGRMINGTIENCYVSGSVANGSPVGGMVGMMDGGNLSNCHASVSVTAQNENSYAGGLMGKMTSGEISQCYASATITSSGTQSYIGGLVGEMSSGTIDQSITTGTLTATGTESYVGGLVGKNSATVTNCYSTADVSSSYNAAGLVAYNYGLVDKCYAMGDLFSNNYAAGVIGYSDGSNAVISNCAAMNNKIDIVYESQSSQSGGYGQRIIGGIKNSAPAPEMNNYALKTMQVSVNDVPQRVYDDIMNGASKTEAELTEGSTYQELDWDFRDVWDIDEGNEYPKLKWEATSSPSGIIRGDANGDEEVNVTDYMAIANYILGVNIANFNETAADVNIDGYVNVTDYVGVANIILYGNYQGNSPHAINAKKAETSSTWMDIENTEDGNVNVFVHGAKTFSAFQMDIVLPEGLEISNVRMAKANQTKNLGFARLQDGTWRLLYGTLENKPVSLVEDHLLTIELRSDKPNAGGNVSVENILLTKENTSTLQLNNVFTNVVTGIYQVGNGDRSIENAAIYDLSGRRVSVSSALPKGVYIMNGKRIIK